MGEFNWQSFISGVCISAFIFSGYLLTEKEKRENENYSPIPSPPDNNYKNIKSWDYQKSKWNTYKPSVNYSDEEIRILKEKQSFQSDGSYIYTPGRHVPSREELSRKEIERYIDKHGEELYEELHDKYGN